MSWSITYEKYLFIVIILKAFFCSDVTPFLLTNCCYRAAHHYHISRDRQTEQCSSLSSNSIDNHSSSSIEQISFPKYTNVTTIHEYFMKRALQLAQYGSEQYMEVPIGAIVVRNLTITSNSNSLRKGMTTTAQQEQHEQQEEQIYEILSEQHNRVEMEYDATAHAEILALRMAAKTIQNWRLSVPSSPQYTNNYNNNNNHHDNDDNVSSIRTILYCTLEPCMMCFSAAQAFRIQQIVYGAPDIRLGSCGSYCDIRSIVPKHPYHTIINITSNIYANESSTMLRNFFRHRRRQQQQQ